MWLVGQAHCRRVEATAVETHKVLIYHLKWDETSQDVSMGEQVPKSEAWRGGRCRVGWRIRSCC